MYYPGMMPTADKRFYCTALGQAFNSFALKCFMNIWHWIVWPTEDKSVKPSGFVTRQHVSTKLISPSVSLCFIRHSQPLILQSSEMSIWWHIIYSSQSQSWLATQTQNNIGPLLCIFQVDFVSSVGVCTHNLWLHDFFSCLSFSSLFLPLGSRAKVGRERGGHGPETALKPQPLFKWGCSLVHYSAFPLSCRRKRGMWKCILVSFLTHFFFFFPFYAATMA